MQFHSEFVICYGANHFLGFEAASYRGRWVLASIGKYRKQNFLIAFIP